MVSDRLRRYAGKLNGSQKAVDSLRQESTHVQERIDDLRKELLAKTDAVTATNHSLQRALNRQGVGAYLEPIYRRDKAVRSCFVLAVHEWGNTGDLAIGYAETAFIKEHFPDLPVYNISRLTLLSNWQLIRNTITDKDLIILPGGGNMGDLWIHEEAARRLVVREFPENVIISFPQSIKFNTEEELKQTSEIYSGHKKLLVALRDDSSYEIAKQNFKGVKVVRTDDIVMSYEYPGANWEYWGGVLFVMRNDKEKRQGSGIEELQKKVANLPIRQTDTLVEGLDFISFEHASRLVYEKIDEFHAASLIVTDRLHGAIFALLAGRPVIVYDNNYGKIAGALKGIADLVGDRMLIANQNGSNITDDDVKRMMQMGESPMKPHELLKDNFNNFAKEIKRAFEA